MHFKIETISALPADFSYRKFSATESYGYALTGRLECLSANHPPVAPLRLQAYRDTVYRLIVTRLTHSLGPLAVVSLHRLRVIPKSVMCLRFWKRERLAGKAVS